MLDIHPTARISKFADIEDSVRGTKLIVGPRVMIDAFVKIKPVGGSGDVVIADDTQINSGCVIYSGNGIRIGKNVLIAANCTLAATNHEFARADVPIAQQRFQPSRGGIVIEDDVWIGAGTILLDGAVVGRGSVIAAGSLVRGAVGAYGVYAGNPLRLIQRRGA